MKPMATTPPTSAAPSKPARPAPAPAVLSTVSNGEKRLAGADPGQNRGSPIAGNGAKRPDHGHDGRFVPGNQAAAGARHAKSVAALRRAFVTELSTADMARIARALCEKAVRGDVKAAQVLLAYSLGKPEAAAWSDDTIMAAEAGMAKAEKDLAAAGDQRSPAQKLLDEVDGWMKTARPS
jgi:hypothetical protein